MPRRGPTTGAKPNRDDHSHFAEDIWEWMKKNRNMIFLCLTILIVGSVIFVIRSRSATKTRNRAQEALGSYFFDPNRSEQSSDRVEKLKKSVSRFGGMKNVSPWLRLQLGSVYYENRQYENSLSILRKLREKHPDSQAAELAESFIKGIQKEQKFMNETVPKRKRKLDQKVSYYQQVFEVSEREQTSSSRNPSNKKTVEQP